ncbi:MULTISPECIES: DnaB-like helicase C-terminal domain-containing protein [unclassified Mesorhizobium]|uniref:replicative DNA helicase n=1 Tax=unclassified Mesorhizobium TaxID=325217 RepID=UPI001FE15B48|nr:MULTISPECIES: DnaB-like helicase C-terminal domain-containing protein [unclassified Mesorhizobium]
MSAASQTIPDAAYVPEIEQDVLGTLLFGGDFRKVMSFLREDHFVPDIHRMLFRAIRAAHEQYGSTTMPIVSRLLPEDAKILFAQKTDQSPSAYMADLASASVAGPPGLERGGKAVVAQWARLKTAEVGKLLRETAHDATSDTKVTIQSVSSDLDTIAAELRAGPRRKSRVTLAEAAVGAFAEIEEAQQRGNGLTGITWGLTDVNRATGGIQRGEMTVIGARPSMGKTAVGFSVAVRTAKSGAGTGFISLEMGAKRLAMRALTDIAYDWGIQIAYSNLITGRVEPGEIDTLKSACRDLDTLPLWIEEQPGLSMTDVRVKTERMMESAEAVGCPLGVLFVDYLQLIRPSARYQGNRNNEIAEISGGLRELARECNLGVVALSQLSRNIESRAMNERRPMMSDLRDSGAIEQDADTIIFLFREAYYLEKEKGKDAEAEVNRVSRLSDVQNKLEFIIGKQRNGPVKTIDLFVDIACSAVRNSARL